MIKINHQFNTITTMGLGNIMVSNNFYLCLIVVYCIVGLAVITMCVDLASAHLKMLFTKLHYFGRKFRGARDTFLMAMSDDIKEALRLLAALKRARPADRSGRITLEDIKTFLEIELQQRTQPFIPLAIEHLRYVDEEEVDSLPTPIMGPDGSTLICCTLGAHQIPYFLGSDSLISKMSTPAGKQRMETASTNHSLNVLSL
uniref:EF-hand domain-containing protein n=1 Tax=Romanomermis culicivorax TaxID=13658 RepID=A0A915KC70_ROMCU